MLSTKLRREISRLLAEFAEQGDVAASSATDLERLMRVKVLPERRREKRVCHAIAAAALLLTAATSSPGREFTGRGGAPLPDVLGEPQSYTVLPGESLPEIARKFSLGFNEIADANRGVDPFVPDAGSKLLLPVSWIVPEGLDPQTIMVNLSEFRLYYRFDRGGEETVATFPVGIGADGNTSPLGLFRVVDKKENPPWYVPPSIRKERPGLPPVVPPGPDNPLGTHALRLTGGGYLIHGTNRPWGVGRRVSHGCIRLYPEEICKLYRLTPVGTAVRFVRQPVKLGVRNGRLFVEVHDDPEASLPDADAALLAARQRFAGEIDREKLTRALREKNGVPVDVTAGGQPETLFAGTRHR